MALFSMDNDRTITLGVPSIISFYAKYTPLIIAITYFHSMFCCDSFLRRNMYGNKRNNMEVN
jgi:hypothetical protein